MPEKLRLAEINYHHHAEFDTAAPVIQKHRPSNLVLGALQSKIDVTLVKHAGIEAFQAADGVKYGIFIGARSFFHIPGRAHRFVSSISPSWVLVPGFIFPFQIILLRKKLGRNCKIVLQHQGDIPGGKKISVQRMADRWVDAYLFRAQGNADPWIRSGVIRDERKIFEVPDATTWFTPQDKATSASITGINGQPSFLWVGRMDDNKDPLTVLDAFEKYAGEQPGPKLYMITTGGPLHFVVKSRIEGSDILRDCVVLAGEVDHESMPAWYSAADYFILSSHREGGSYALTEAMACGCVPVVSDIPPSLHAIGKTGYFFKKGDSQSLLAVLRQLRTEKPCESSEQVLQHFRSSLSAHAAAERLYHVLLSIHAK